MQIVTIIEGKLYASDLVDDWTAVNAIAPTLIINLAGEQAEDPPRQLKRPVFVDWHIDDVPRLPDTAKLKRIAKFAKKWMKKDGPVLVHDHSGHNRVYLMVAQILHELQPKQDGEDVIRYIKARHSTALQNQTFKDYVRNL